MRHRVHLAAIAIAVLALAGLSATAPGSRVAAARLPLGAAGRGVRTAMATRPRALLPAPILSVRRAEPARLDGFGTHYQGQEQLFVYLDVNDRYRGPEVHYFDARNLLLRNAAGKTYSPQQYDGPGELKSRDTIDTPTPDHLFGWLLYTLPITDAVALQVLFKETDQPAPGIYHTYIVAATPPFTPKSSDKRTYAVAVQPALTAYLVDEALVAGSIRAATDPLLQATGAVGLDPAMLIRQRATLAADRRAFERVPARSKDALTSKAAAGAVFAALDGDLTRLIVARHPADLSSAGAAFAIDDHALGDLYQDWPGAQLAPA